jgi:hypothetical protein
MSPAQTSVDHNHRSVTYADRVVEYETPFFHIVE